MDKDNISLYISKIAKGDSPVDVCLFEEVKELIYAKYGVGFKYINDHVIQHIDREIEHANRNMVDQDIDSMDRNTLIKYIEKVLNDTQHPLCSYLGEAINQDSVITVWGDNGSQVLSINALIDNIISIFRTLKLIEEDEQKLIVRPRDLHKIDDAISLIKTISNDVHLLYHLNNLKHEKTITKAKILSSSFYQFTKILDSDFQLNKSQVVKIANDIMTQVFDSQKDYRIYSNIEEFRYKGLYLTRYTS